MAQRIKKFAVVMGLTASVALALLVVEYTYGPRLLSSLQKVKRVDAPGVVDSSPPTSPLELSVFDQPRDVPEIHFADEVGHDLTLAEFRGRVVLLNIWATWCVPCRKEMPALDRLQAKLGGNDFAVIPLSIDRQGVASVKRFYQELGLEKLAIYVDPLGKGSRALAIPGVPTTLLIDRKGREVARKMGAAEWDGPEMVSLVERTLAAPSAEQGNRDR